MARGRSTTIALVAAWVHTCAPIHPEVPEQGAGVEGATGSNQANDIGAVDFPKETAREADENLTVAMQAVVRQKAETGLIQAANTQRSLGDISRAVDSYEGATQVVNGLRAQIPRAGEVEDGESMQKWEDASAALVKNQELRASLMEFMVEEKNVLEQFAATASDVMTRMQSSHCMEKREMKCDLGRYAREVSLLKGAVADLRRVSTGVAQVRTDHGQLQNLYEVERLIPSNRDEIEVKEAMEQHRSFSRDIAKQFAEEQELRTLRALGQSHLEERNKEVERMRRLQQGLEAQKKEQEAGIEALERARRSEGEELRRKVKEMVDRSQKDLQKLHEASKATQDGLVQEFESAQRRLQQKRIEAEVELAGLDDSKAGPNHFLFLLDSSGSMSGYRWAALLNAYNRFIATRVARNTGDRVSVILFHHSAWVVFENRPIDSDVGFPSGYWGGTAYAPAWELARTVAAQISMRTVIVFMSDGYASDINAAASYAGQIHAEKGQTRLITFVVLFEAGLSRETLAPIVRQGNGGQDTYDYQGQRLPLQLDVTAANIAEVFAKIAGTSDPRVEALERRLDRVNKIMQNQKAQSGDMTKLVESIGETRSRQADLQKKSAENLRLAMESDSNSAARLLDEQKMQAQQRVSELNGQLEAARAAETAAKDAASKLTEEIRAVEGTLNVTTQNRADMISGLQRRQAQLGGDRVKLITEQHERVLRTTGKRSHKDVLALADGITRYQGLLERERALVTSVKSFVHHIALNVENFAEALENPVPIDMPAVSKFDFIVMYYNTTVDLPLQTPLRTQENFRKILEHLAEQLEVEPSEKESVIRCIVQTFVGEELCDITAKQLEDNLENKGKNRKDKFDLRLRDCFAAGTKSTQKIFAKLKGLEEKLRKISKDMGKVEDDMADAEEKQDQAKTEKLAARLERLEGQKAAVEEDRDKYDLEVMEVVDVFLSPAKNLLRLFVSELTKAFDYQMAELEKEALNSMLTSFKDTVLVRIGAFSQKVHDTQRRINSPNLPSALPLPSGAQLHAGTEALPPPQSGGADECNADSQNCAATVP